MNNRCHVRFGDFLVAEGLLHADQLTIALNTQRALGKPLGETLIEMGFAMPAVIWPLLAMRMGVPLVTPYADQFTGENPIPANLARRYQVWPIDIDPAQKSMTLAMSRPQDSVAIEMINRHLDRKWKISAALCDPALIARLLAQEQPATAWSVLDAPELFDQFLTEATRLRASDIHFEPTSHCINIRMRVDGVLQLVRSMSRDSWPTLANRIKTLAQLDITESRRPQDGRISWAQASVQLEVRVATLPTLDGENIVLRLADRHASHRNLTELGLDKDVVRILLDAIAHPEGLILVSGPTGSGKTTTLYSLLGQLNETGRAIATLEDPVEIRMPMARQTEISDPLGFADGVRALLRQDPDVILIGEIRDPDTARMAMRAAMTGHRVLSTVHASSSQTAIWRMLELGVAAEQLCTELRLVIAQRLLRTLCKSCRIESNRGDGTWQAVGCPQCNGVGYRGRSIAIECLLPEPGLKLLSGDRLSALAALQPSITLFDNAMCLARNGITSIEEVHRVVGHAGMPAC